MSKPNRKPSPKAITKLLVKQARSLRRGAKDGDVDLKTIHRALTRLMKKIPDVKK